MPSTIYFALVCWQFVGYNCVEKLIDFFFSRNIHNVVQEKNSKSKFQSGRVVSTLSFRTEISFQQQWENTGTEHILKCVFRWGNNVSNRKSLHSITNKTKTPKTGDSVQVNTSLRILVFNSRVKWDLYPEKDTNELEFYPSIFIANSIWPLFVWIPTKNRFYLFFELWNRSILILSCYKWFTVLVM